MKQGVTDESGRFFILSSSGKYVDSSFGNEDLNLAVLELLGDDALKNEQRNGLRNYFLQRATLANNVHALNQALRGLKILEYVPVLKVNDASSVSLSQGSTEVKVELLNNFGTLFKGAKTIKSQLVQLDGTKGTKDVSVKFNKENNVGTVNLA